MALTKAGNKVIQTPYRKNVIINGDMNIWQRGTSFTGISSTTVKTADRFSAASVCAGVLTVEKSTSVPTLAASGRKWPASLDVSVTTADTSIVGDDYAVVVYKVEGYDTVPLIGHTCTLSFWVSSAKTGVHCVAFRNVGGDKSYTAEYSISAANTWEFKSVTVGMHDGTSGTWNFTNGMGLYLWFTLACGSNLHTTANQWTDAGVATANQVNLMDTIGNHFLLTGVQLELGSVATPFEYRPFAEELALCQRYYEKSYFHSDAPGTVGYTNYRSCIGVAAYLSRFYILGNNYVVPKRTTPGTLTVYALDGTSGSISVYNNSASKIVISSVAAAGATHIAGYLQGATSGTAGELYAFHYTADAEL